MSKLIAVVDDESDIVDLVTINLKKEGYSVKGFLNGEDFYQYIKNNTPDLIILDLMLPDSDGLDICRFIRADIKFRDTNIIMLTAKDDEIDKIVGLELGADDYMTKPFSPKELNARIKAIFRRKSRADKNVMLEIGNALRIDPENYIVFADNARVELTVTEFRLLMILAEKIGRVFTREQLLDHLWGNEKIVLDRTIDVHITHLRNKLGKAGRLIKNLRGVGYKLEI